jgi:hypothetical protein
VSSQLHDATLTTIPTMKTIQITSRHSSVSDAVAAANIDLSYNACLAKNKIADLDMNVRQAFVTEDGKVMFVYNCDIPILQEFSPFISCLDNRPFAIAFIDKMIMSVTDPLIQKNKEGRKAIARMIKQMSAENKIEAFAY